jgi:UDP-3-O-[3-hydroxymyristoyl] glucosamine N-acyltransferase
MLINELLFKEATGINTSLVFEAKQLALVNSQMPGTLTFIDDKKYLNEVNENKNIVIVITTEEIAKGILKNQKKILVDDPRYEFYQLLNYLGKKNYVKINSKIHGSAKIHDKAYVSEFNVSIGENTIIGPNATILPDVSIGDNCVIQPGTVVGSEGFEYKRTSKGILPVFHDGKVCIGNRVEVGSNTCIDKGFSFKNTIIEDDVKIDNLVHVAHGVHIMKGAFIIAGTILGGSTIIGEEAWLGINASTAPGITIGNNGFVSMGAVVTKNVDEKQQVTGNLAIPHQIFLKILKRNLSEP